MRTRPKQNESLKQTTTAGPAPESRHRFKFGPRHRILRRADFQRTYGEGRRAHGRFVAVFCRRRAEGEPGGEFWRLGITATRKSGNAVRRNRQRRLVREYFRLNQHWLPGDCDFVVNTRSGLSGASLAELGKDLDRVMQRFGFRPQAEPNVRSKTQAEVAEPKEGQGANKGQ